MALRLDRIASLYLVSPLVQSTTGIPILMYHSIANEDEASVHPYYRVSVPPAVFAEQMQHLHDQGYTTGSLLDVISPTHSGPHPSQKRVVITFDDGYENFYREAFPVLQQFGFTATVFLPTSFIGCDSIQFNRRGCMTWSQVRELHRHGITIGSHTVSHPQLHNLCKTLIRHELFDSRKTIQDNISAPVDTFAYPYAFPQADAAFREVLHEYLCDAGYVSGVCTTVGRAGPHSEPLFLPRLPVNGADDRDLLQAKLTGAYDWVGWPQFMIKRLRGLLVEDY